MKRHYFSLLLTCLTASAFAGSVFAAPLKTASFIVRTVDEEGRPVSNAVVEIGFNQGYGPGMIHEFEKLSATTDTNGLCTLAGKCDGTLGGNVHKSGYYRSLLNNISITNSTLSHWLPIDKEYKVILRPILNPIPMYAKRTNLRIPVSGDSLGYDLEKGDWLLPYGNGSTADFLFRVQCVWSGEESPYGEKYYDATVDLTFSNEDDGIIEFADSQPASEGSIFRLPRFAPEVGYASHWSLQQFMNAEGSHYQTDSQREPLNYFIRVRTKKDETGKIIAANYGKIRKPLQLVVTPENTWVSMAYYFNPTPNDRNMEFDPKQNLFTDLEPLEKVNDP